MCKSDSQFNKYKIPMMTVMFFRVITADIQKVSLKMLHSGIEYKLSDGRISHIFDGLI